MSLLDNAEISEEKQDIAWFADNEINMLTEFKAWWIVKHSEDPEMFPETFEYPGEWDEQYRSFCEMYHEER